jgi:hypothetical protein
VDNVEIERELAELIGANEGKVDQQGSEILVDKSQDNSKKESKVKKQFVLLSKGDFDKLSKREQFEYKIELSKNRTDELKNEYQSYKSKQTETSRSLETKRLIIAGRFLETQMKDRKDQYAMVKDHLDAYLTKDSDRKLFGFPSLAKSDGAN